MILREFEGFYLGKFCPDCEKKGKERFRKKKKKRHEKRKEALGQEQG